MKKMDKTKQIYSSNQTNDNDKCSKLISFREKNETKKVTTFTIIRKKCRRQKEREWKKFHLSIHTVSLFFHDEMMIMVHLKHFYREKKNWLLVVDNYLVVNIDRY